MRKVYRVEKCNCTGKWFEERKITVLHAKKCPISKLQEKFGYRVEKYMEKL